MNISGSFELIDTNGEHGTLTWTTVPLNYLIANSENSGPPPSPDSDDDEQLETASLEIRKPLNYFGNNLQIVIPPTNQNLYIKQIYAQITENVIPIFIYIIDQGKLLDKDIDELRLFRRIAPNEPILFIRIDQTDL